jgi:hypothetical protein
MAFFLDSTLSRLLLLLLLLLLLPWTLWPSILIPYRRNQTTRREESEPHSSESYKFRRSCSEPVI